MLQGLDKVPWADLEHAYGSAADVPDLLRKLLDPDPKVRSNTLWHLYGNVFHQGTRYPATPYVIPFLLEMISRPAVPNRAELLSFWGSLITGYFNVLERPVWGDGEHIYWCDEIDDAASKDGDQYAQALHQIYRESLKGHGLACELLADSDTGVRAEAAFVLACLPTKADCSVPRIEEQLRLEQMDWVRAAFAFALGELGASVALRRLAADDRAAAVRCMALCQLARMDPSADLVDPLLRFIAEPIEDFERIPGAGGKSTGVAAFSISHLPTEVQRAAIPAICDRLELARSFDTVPLVRTLLSAAFSVCKEQLKELNDIQCHVLTRMLNTEELWSIGNIMLELPAYGLPSTREKCAELAGVKVANDPALTELRGALAFADMGGFLEKARAGITKALEIDPAVFERAAAPDECWLLCAKAFAETDPKRAVEAFRRACSINPAAAHRVDPRWRLAEVLREHGDD